MATLIHGAVHRDQVRPRVPQLPIDQLRQLERWDRLGLIATSRGWYLAAARIRQDVIATLKSIRESVYQSLHAAGELVTPSLKFSVADIMRDLQALEADYVDVKLDHKNRTVSVTTEPVELEGTFFGPFQVMLDLRYLGHSHPYRVIAKDPHPAVSCDSTTHPHVQSESLCEGDGHHAIKQALADGRVHDFFLIVNQILHTYNSGSAYIRIDDWNGVDCGACGDTVDKDECGSCSRCSDRICSDCSCSCDGCDDSFCDSCTSACESCENTYCGGCISSCDHCDKPYCEHCLTGSLCDDCIDEENTDEESEEGSDVPEAAVHAICVGQADLHA